MHLFLNLLWNYHVPTMAGVYALLVFIVYAGARTVAKPKRPQARAAAAVLSMMIALLFWVGIKIACHTHLGGEALAVARSMPAGHPQLAEFQRVRDAYDIEGMKKWARFNRNPVDAGVIVKTQAALDKLPPSMFKTQLQAELATGYLSELRFQAAALSIIQISMNELEDAPELATETPDR